MNKKKPVNLDLSSLSYPPMAIVSILHRISGIILFLLLPYMLHLLHLSLISQESFNQISLFIFNKFIIWSFSAAMTFHLLAGIRHMIMDLGFGEELAAGRNTAILVMVLTAILVTFEGIWLW